VAAWKNSFFDLRYGQGRTQDWEFNPVVMAHYLLLYARTGGTVYLLSIRHQRQLSFDLASHWSV
jgi:hypothetical protein